MNQKMKNQYSSTSVELFKVESNLNNFGFKILKEHLNHIEGKMGGMKEKLKYHSYPNF